MQIKMHTLLHCILLVLKGKKTPLLFATALGCELVSLVDIARKKINLAALS